LPGRASNRIVRDFTITPLVNRIAVLASGGLDSSVLLAESARRGLRVFPIYVRAGLAWERDELAVLRRFIRAFGRSAIEPVAVLRMPIDDLTPRHWSVSGRGVPGFSAAMSSNYIVGRNLSLLSKAAIFCAQNRIGEIAMAALGSNPFPDANPRFLRALSQAVKLGIGLDLRIVTPYAHLTKADVIARGHDLPLRLTVSCIRPIGIRHCGACTKCAERIEGFRAAGVPDPTSYRRRGR
jgi:7-cyano-7-deazaguanine synthase